MPHQPAIGVDAHVNIFQFKTAYDVDTTNVWTEGTDGSPTFAVQDARGGKAMISPPTGDNNHAYYITNYEIAGLSAGKGLWILGSIELADADDADWFWGLCAKVSAADALFDARVNAVGFYGADGSALINCETKLTTASQVSSGESLADATEKELAIRVDGVSRAWFYVNGAYVAMRDTYIPTTELAVAFGVRNGATTGINTMTLSGIKLIQDY